MKKEILVGQWNCVLDNWRLWIPSEIAGEFGRFALLREDRKNGCIQIYPFSLSKVKNPTSVFKQEVEIIQRKRPVNKGNGKTQKKTRFYYYTYGKRILIPSSLRGSSSFWFGKTVTLVSCLDHLEIWPRSNF